MVKKVFLGVGALLLPLIVYYTIIIISARDKTPGIVSRALASDRIELSLNDLNEEHLKALLKIQDPNFYGHNGYDFSTPGTGKTTISQGLVKMYYFKDFRPGFHKIEQTLIARFALDALTPKDTILKLFVNEVYLGEHQGHTVKGFAAASRSYFSKSFHDLTWEEYLSIVAMIRAPAMYHIVLQPGANKDRVLKIKRMLDGEYIPRDNSDWLYDRP